MTTTFGCYSLYYNLYPGSMHTGSAGIDDTMTLIVTRPMRVISLTCWPDEFIARYTEPQRHFHTLNHIQAMLRCLDQFQSLVPTEYAHYANTARLETQGSEVVSWLKSLVFVFYEAEREGTWSRK